MIQTDPTSGGDSQHRGDPRIHLQALKNFAHRSPNEVPRDQLLPLIEEFMPVVESYLSGAHDGHTAQELGRLSLPLSQCIRSWVQYFQEHAQGLNRDPSFQQLGNHLVHGGGAAEAIFISLGQQGDEARMIREQIGADAQHDGLIASVESAKEHLSHLKDLPKRCQEWGFD